jgi:predicted kinase
MPNELHIVTGAAGVGKSTWGRSFAAKVPAAFLDSDTVSEAVVRAGMKAAGLDPTDRDGPEYKAIFRDAVYECLFATAEENLAHTSVVMVGPFTRELQTPDWPKQLTTRFGVTPQIWFLNCRDETRRSRITARGNPRDQLKLENWDQHLAQLKTQTTDSMPAFSCLHIDTD